MSIPTTSHESNTPVAPISTRPSGSSRRPLILDYYYFTEEHESYLTNTLNKLHLKCRLCNREIAASIKITSNWITHLKTVHLSEYQEYALNKIPKVRYNRSMLINQQNYKMNDSFQSSLTANNMNYDQRFTNVLNGANQLTFDDNEEENEEDLIDYEENENEYFKNENNSWNETNNNNKSEDASNLDANGNWFADEQNNNSLITTTEASQNFLLRNMNNNNARKRPLTNASLTLSPRETKRPMTINNDEKANDSFSNFNKHDSSSFAITTTTNGLTNHNTSIDSHSTVLVKNVIKSMVDLIRGSSESEKKVLCLECHTKIKWVDYFTHTCESDK